MTRQSATRAAKASELFERLNVLACTADPDSFALRRIEQDARRLMRADAAGAHTVLGALAALREDADEVHRHYKIALQQSASPSMVNVNYAISLLHIGESNEAFEAARKAFKNTRDSAEALDQFIRAAVASARFVQARELCGYWKKLFPDQNAPYGEAIGMLAEAVEHGAFSEEGAREVLHVAHEVRQNARARLMETVVVPDDLEPHGFFFKFYVLTSNDTAVQLNDRLIEEVIGREWLGEDPGFKFTPMFIGTTQDGSNRERPA